MVKTRAQVHQEWTYPIYFEHPQHLDQERLVVGIEVDVLDHTGVWCPGQVDEVNSENNSIKIHFRGWSAVENDEVIFLPQGGYRLAEPNTYTRCAKCTIELFDARGSEHFENWPCVVHFRMPDPFGRIPLQQDPPVPDLPRIVLRASKHLFVVPYLPHLLPEPSIEWWRQIELDGGMWVHRSLLQPWTFDQDLNHLDRVQQENLGLAQANGLQDTQVSVVLAKDILQQGALLQDEFLGSVLSFSNPLQDADQLSSASSLDDSQSWQKVGSHGTHDEDDSSSFSELPSVDLRADWEMVRDSTIEEDDNADEAWMGGSYSVLDTIAPVVGSEVDILDNDLVWTPGRVLGDVSLNVVLLGIGKVDIHFDGFSKLWDHSLELPEDKPKIAPRGTHTKAMKCCIELSTEQCNGIQICTLWPCKVLFRVPEQRDNNPLRSAKQVFVMPYRLADLQQWFCGGNWVDGGLWVSTNDIRPWMQPSQPQQHVGCDALAAYQEAEQDSSAPLLTSSQMFEVGTMLKMDLSCSFNQFSQFDRAPIRRVSNDFPPTSPTTCMRDIAEAVVAMYGQSF